MLFGRRNIEPAQQVRISGAATLLGQLFDSSLSGFDSRSKRIIERLDDDWRSFSKVCDDFNKGASEPDLEDLRSITRSNILMLKQNYLTALKEAVSEERWHPAHNTVYEAQKSKLDENERRIRQILQINHRFKPVIIAYSAKVDSFKWISPSSRSR